MRPPVLADQNHDPELQQHQQTLCREATTSSSRRDAGLSFADDVTIIHGDGKLITKAEEIENFKSDGSSRFRTLPA